MAYQFDAVIQDGESHGHLLLVGHLVRLIVMRCPRACDELIRSAGGQWAPGGRRWLQRRRIDQVIRTLQRSLDPLFRHAGIAVWWRTDEARTDL
jgi:hypothetical protein